MSGNTSSSFSSSLLSSSMEGASSYAQEASEDGVPLGAFDSVGSGSGLGGGNVVVVARHSSEDDLRDALSTELDEDRVVSDVGSQEMDGEQEVDCLTGPLSMEATAVKVNRGKGKLIVGVVALGALFCALLAGTALISLVPYVILPALASNSPALAASIGAITASTKGTLAAGTAVGVGSTIGGIASLGALLGFVASVAKAASKTLEEKLEDVQRELDKAKGQRRELTNSVFYDDIVSELNFDVTDLDSLEYKLTTRINDFESQIEGLERDMSEVSDQRRINAQQDNLVRIINENIDNLNNLRSSYDAEAGNLRTVVLDPIYEVDVEDAEALNELRTKFNARVKFLQKVQSARDSLSILNERISRLEDKRAKLQAKLEEAEDAEYDDIDCNIVGDDIEFSEGEGSNSEFEGLQDS